MRIKIGTKLASLPTPRKFGVGAETIFIRKGWDKTLQENPFMWVCLDVLPKNGMKSNGTYWTRAKQYNERYGSEGYSFSARYLDGVYTFWGRYETK
tara:strand:- start:140 stop:427 length:288 start_codon:yes stop_codon:yes gene_type:complete